MASKNDNLVMKTSAIPLLGVLLAFLIASAVSIFVVQTRTSDDHQARLVNLIADNIQTRVNQVQSQFTAQVQGIAGSAHLTALLFDGDAAAISNEEARLLELLPGAIRIRIFRKGEAEIDRETDPPFTFTSKNLVNRVEAGETVYPEAVNANGRWIISLAAPIKTPADGAIAGTLFIYLEPAVFSLSLIDGLHGELKLTQSFRNTPETEFLRLGSDAGNIEIKRGLTNKHWKFNFHPSNHLLGEAAADMTIFLLPAIAAFIVTFLGVLIGSSRVAANLRADTTTLHDQISNLNSNNFKASDDYVYANFLELDAVVSKMAERAAQSRKAQTAEALAGLKPATNIGMVDIEMIDQLNEGQTEPVVEDIEEPEVVIDISGIFRAYDIRGVVGDTLVPEVVAKIGQAIGTEAGEIGDQTLLVGADGRLSSPELVEALIAGLIDSGRDVINIGFVPTPLLYYAIHNSEANSGVMLTGSHNPLDHNGMKVVLNGKALTEDEIQNLYKRYLNEDFSSGQGQVTEMDIREDYMNAITDDVVVAKPLKVVVDCGNGIAGEITPELFTNLGCEVIPLYCEVDGNFPNHHPDPIDPSNLEDLIITVRSQGADIGIALDGDGDRLVAITREGEIVWPDRLLMLFAKDVVSRNPGSDVVYDIKCTRHLNSVISGFGGRPVICRSGHSFIKAKMAETDASLGGEMSGHICFKERWFGFDDGLYSAARLLEIVGSQSEGLGELLEEFPTSIATPEIRITVPESKKFEIVDQLIKNVDMEEATITTIDGLRIDFSDSWGLVRASNTNPHLTLRFEADNDQSLENIQALFRDALKSVDESLVF